MARTTDAPAALRLLPRGAVVMAGRSTGPGGALLCGVYRCLTCGGPVTVTGTATAAPVSMRLAVHTDTGRELGGDGHLVAPIEAALTAAGAQPETPES